MALAAAPGLLSAFAADSLADLTRLGLPALLLLAALAESGVLGRKNALLAMPAIGLAIAGLIAPGAVDGVLATALVLGSAGLGLSALGGAAGAALRRAVAAALLVIAALSIGAPTSADGGRLAVLLQISLPALLLALWAGTHRPAGERETAGTLPQRLACSVQAGIALTVMLGWLLGSAYVVQGGTAAVPMQFNTALCHLLTAAALWAMTHAWRRLAFLALSAALLIVVPSLLVELFDLPLGIDQWLFTHPFTVEGVPPGRMAPNTAIAFLVGGLGIALQARTPARPALWIVVWACGALVALSALIVLAGYALGVPAARGWGAQTPMAVMTALAFAGNGLALLSSGREGGRRYQQQTLWLPVMVLAGSVILALQLGIAVRQQRDTLIDAALVQQADAAARSLRAGVQLRADALRRFADRLTAPGVGAQTRLFETDARAYLDDFPSIDALLLLDENLLVRQQLARRADSVAPVDAALTLDAARQSPFRRAAADGNPALSAPLSWRNDGAGALLVFPLGKANADGDGFLAAGIAYRVLLGDLLENTGGITVRVRQGDHILFQVGEPPGAPDPQLRRLQFYGQEWELAVWPSHPQPIDRLPQVLLSGSLVAGLLLALALRYAGLARQRAEQAEANRSALEQQIIESARVRSALDESERDLVGVLESISDAFYLLDDRWRYVFANAEAARLQGTTRDQLLGHTPWELFPESAELVRPHFERAVRDNRPYLDEVHYPPFDAWFEIRAYPHRRGLAVYFRDITERKRKALEDAKRRAEAERAQQLASLGSWEYDLRNDRLLWSGQTARIFGLPEGYQPRSVGDLLERVHPDDRVALRDSQLGANVGAADIDIEYRILRPDGELRYVHELGTLLRDAQGEPLLVTGALQDITERKRSEESLRRSEGLLRIAGRVARLGAWSYTLGADQVELSDQACDIHGLPPGSTLTLEDALACYAAPHRERIAACVDACVTLGEPYDEELEMHDARGRMLWVRAIGEAVRDADGHIVRLQGALQDISERKQVERALETERHFLRALLENLAEGVVACDAEGMLTTFNRATRTFHALPEQRLPAQEWARHYNLFHPDGRPMAADEVPLARALRGEPVVDQILRIAPVNAAERIVQCTGQRIVDDDGSVLGAVVAMHDITAAHRAAEFESAQRAVLTGIAAGKPLPDSLEALCRLHERQFPGSLCSLLQLDESGRHLLGGAAPTLPGDYLRALRGEAIGPRAGSCGTAAYTRQRVVVSDIAHDPLWADYAEAALAHGLRACWSTPVMDTSGRVVATLAVYYREVRAPAADELAASEGLAAMAAIAIEQGMALRRLRLSEQRFRSLFDEHPDAVFALDLAGRFTACNAGFERLSGRSGKEVIGRFFDEGLAASQRAVVRQHFTAAARGEARTFEVRIALADTGEAELRATQLPIIVDGEVVGVFAIAHDIGPLRQRERELAQALRGAEAASLRLRRLGDASLTVARGGSEEDIAQRVVDQLAIVLPCRDVILRDATGTRTRGSTDALPDWPVPPVVDALTILGDPDLQRRGDGLPRGASWLAVPLLGSGERRIGQIELRRLDGTPFGDDEQAIVLQFAQLAAGILERSQLIARLRVRDRFFEMAAELFCVFDPAQRRFVQVNPAFVRLLGYDEKTLLSRPYSDFLHPDDLAASAVAAAKVEGGESLAEFINRYRCADGSIRWLEWATVAARDGLSFCVARDITARRRTERALQQAFEDLRVRNRELQDFAFVASHDLQEPLRKIRAFSDRLLARYREQLDEQARDYLQRTAQAAARMQVLIDDLLAYSRVNSRGKPFTEVDLQRLVATVIEDLEARIESSGGRVEVGMLPRLDGDPTQLRQMLQNLIANALKFRSPERPPVVHISASPRTLEGGRAGWALCIEDNGIGFEQKYAERIFGPFQRLHGRQDFEGTGIGLAIVRRIVERHRGDVQAEGRPGEGARFVVILPERQADPAAQDELVLAPDPNPRPSV